MSTILHCARFVTAVVVTEGALVLNDLGKGFRGLKYMGFAVAVYRVTTK